MIGTLWYAVRFIAGQTAFFSMHLLFSLFLLPLLVIFLHGKARGRVFNAAFHISLAVFIRWFFPLIRGYRFREVSGLERALSARPAVFVVNHRGLLDGPFVLAHIPNMGVVMKARYVKQPFFATFARYLDFISADPESTTSLSRTIERCAEVLKVGKSLLVFPEGTRSPGGRVLTFKDTAFRLAISAGVPIVPVVVHTDFPVFGKRRRIPPRSFAVTVRFLEPVRALDSEKATDFAGRVEREIARIVAELDRGTVWETKG